MGGGRKGGGSGSQCCAVCRTTSTGEALPPSRLRGDTFARASRWEMPSRARVTRWKRMSPLACTAATSASETGLTSAPGLGSTPRNLHRRLGSPLPHLRRDRAQPLPHLHQPSLLPHLHRDWSSPHRPMRCSPRLRTPFPRLGSPRPRAYPVLATRPMRGAHVWVHEARAAKDPHVMLTRSFTAASGTKVPCAPQLHLLAWPILVSARGHVRAREFACVRATCCSGPRLISLSG